MTAAKSFVPVVAVLALACGCSRAGQSAAGEGELPSLNVTHWTDKTELYMEYPPLVAGQKALFAVHLTRLSDFKPITEGRARVEFTPESGGEAKALVGPPPSRPGAFRVEDVPPALTAWLSAILAPILAELSVSRQQLVSQAETIGRQAAELERAASIAVKLSDELEAARAQISRLVVSTATEPPDPTTKPFWSRWRTSAPWLLLAVILLLAVVLLGWLR